MDQNRGGFDTSWELLEQEGFADLLGPVQARFKGNGVAHFRIKTNASHRNRSGFIHGGVLLALADQLMGCTARQSEQLDSHHATIQIDMHFIKAIRVGAVVELHCKVVSARRTVKFTEVEIFGDGDLIATARGIWRNFESTAVLSHAE